MLLWRSLCFLNASSFYSLFHKLSYTFSVIKCKNNGAKELKDLIVYHQATSVNAAMEVFAFTECFSFPLLGTTRVYICCAYSGTLTWSLRSLKLCALHLHSLSLRFLELCTSYSLQRARFALACAAARRSTIILIRNLHTESSSDLQSITLTTRPSGKHCRLRQASPFLLAE